MSDANADDGTVVADEDKTLLDGAVKEPETDKTLLDQGGDDKPPEEKPGGKPEEKPEDKAPEGAPKSYEDFTVPEGVELDKEITSKFSDVAKELNLTQKNAQKIIDLAVEQSKQFGDKNTAALKEASNKWKEETAKDEELGGAKMQENLSIALKAIEKFGNPTFKEMLSESGFGNHPEIIRFMYKVGKAISEDTIVTGKGSGDKAPQSIAERLYSGASK